MKFTDESNYEMYWNSIPIGKENAIGYEELCTLWNANERIVRKILQKLSATDNEDNYILIRSGKGKGFYRTDDADTIIRYKKECLNKGRSIFAPIKKINRVLKSQSDMQFKIYNNLREIRLSKNIKQTEVVRHLRKYEPHFDVSLLSKMENGLVMPTPMHLRNIAEFYGCEPCELISMDLFTVDIYGAI